MWYRPAMPMYDADDLARFRLHAELCKVLTDPKRLMLLGALRETERTVGELAEILGCTLPNVSQHLGVMRGAGLVETRRAGTTIHYRLAEPAIVGACEIVDGIVRRRLGQAPSPGTWIGDPSIVGPAEHAPPVPSLPATSRS
jgi:DNA-binding transcriptional ArsR family regulator